jgi:ABC-type amino acid transport substrate-binding protein
MRSAIAVLLFAVFGLGLFTTAALGQGEELQVRVSARVSGKFVAPAGSEPPGFDVDLLRRFAAWHRVRNGAEVKLTFSYANTVPALLDAVQQGEADLGLGGVTQTAERQQRVDFSPPTLPVRSVLVAPPGVLESARWRQQIASLRLGATVGSTNAAEVERLAAAIPGIRTNTTYTTNEGVFAALAASPRTLDAAIVDLPQYWTTGKANGLLLVDSLGEPQQMAFVLPKGSPLAAQLAAFLDAFTKTNDYFLLIRRYFGGDAEQMVRLSRGG